MELHVVINGRKDLAGQLYNQLRSAIESGRLAAGRSCHPVACWPSNWAFHARPFPTPTLN
jgi:hypothetical protein